MEFSKSYRVGVIGLGNMGARYLEALHANPNYRVIWVCDRNPSILAWASELIHEVIAGEDADQLIAEVEVDILGEFTLADVRPHFIRAALRRRQHVIAEKPIAASIPEEEALLREIEASDRFVAVILFNRNAKSESSRSSTSPIKHLERCQTRNTDRKAIESPAQLAAGELEPGLMELLLADMKGQAHFPSWKMRCSSSGKCATVGASRRRPTRTRPPGRRIGRPRRGVFHKNSECRRTEEQSLCRQLLIDLVHPGEVAADTKRRVSLDDVASTDAVRALLEKLADARLVTTDRDDRPEAAQAEWAHEAFFPF